MRLRILGEVLAIYAVVDATLPHHTALYVNTLMGQLACGGQAFIATLLFDPYRINRCV